MMLRTVALAAAVASTSAPLEARELPHASSSRATEVFQSICLPNTDISTVVGRVKTRFDVKFRTKESSKNGFPGRKFTLSPFVSEGVTFFLQTVRLENTSRYLSCSISVPIRDLDHLVDDVKRILPPKEAVTERQEHTQRIVAWGADQLLAIEVRLTIGDTFPSGFGMITASQHSGTS